MFSISSLLSRNFTFVNPHVSERYRNQTYTSRQIWIATAPEAGLRSSPAGLGEGFREQFGTT
jgi:hypothetical protein